MDKLERLLNLTAALLHTTRPLTAIELRERVGGYPEAKASFRRAFERDKDDLRTMGVPIRVETVPGSDPPVDGYRIVRDEYTGRDLHLDLDELAALHLATNLVRLDGGAADAFVKLGRAPTDAAEEQPAPVSSLPFDDSLSVLVAAAADRRVTYFTYNNEAREVEPWRLSFSRGHWYLTGWDRRREAERVFRVDRVSGGVTLGDAATEPVGDVGDPGRLRGWELGDEEPISARLLVDADQAGWAQHAAGTDGETQPDGSVVLALDVRNVEAFRSFALSLLDHAEVLEPPSLRDDLVGWLDALK